MTAEEREAGLAPAETRGNAARQRMRSLLAQVTAAEKARRN